MRSFKGGIHPYQKRIEKKIALNFKEILECIPKLVTIPMSMNIGAPSKPIVQKNERVLLGQIIGEPQGKIGVPIHASVSGVVKEVTTLRQLGQEPVNCVIIENDFEDKLHESVKPLGNINNLSKEAIIEIIKNSGIVGMGGAAFPTYVKLSPAESQPIDTIILNGMECEPFLAADASLMKTHPASILKGLRVVLFALNVKRGIVAIEDDKPESIEAMKNAAKDSDIEIVVLKTKYPQGAEKQVIKSVTGREVPPGKLPADIGVIVLNVSTANAIAEAVETGMPLVKRVVSVTGAVKKPSNLLLRVGTSFQEAIDFCGGFVGDPGKVLSGGPMMGIAVYDTSVSVTKSTSGIFVLHTNETMPEETNCIHCGACVRVCPMSLEPYLLNAAYEKSLLELAEKHHANDCVLCGACSYICPAGRKLASSIRLLKDKLTRR